MANKPVSFTEGTLKKGGLNPPQSAYRPPTPPSLTRREPPLPSFGATPRPTSKRDV
jgi:hypothetical protein